MRGGGVEAEYVAKVNGEWDGEVGEAEDVKAGVGGCVKEAGVLRG